jgi:NitT/TauT family transport system substrate-binding protein
MDTLLSVSGILNGLGVEQRVPLVGWVFQGHWADAHGAELAAFLRADLAAKQILAESNAEWERLRPLTRVPDQATLVALRDAYRAGIPGCFTAAQRQAAQRVFAILAREGGEALVGSARALSPGTFWKGLDTESCGQGPDR